MSASLEEIARELAPLVCFSEDAETLRGVEFQILSALRRVQEETVKRACDAVIGYVENPARVHSLIRRAFLAGAGVPVREE